MTIIKRLYIELALCKVRNTCPPRPPARLGRTTYEIVTKTYDLENLTFSKTQNPIAFYRDLNILEDKKHLLHIVSTLLSELVEDVVNLRECSIANSYAYFAFTDEQEQTVFSSPYVTSSLLFNPNETRSTYALCDTRRIATKFNKRLKEKFPFSPVDSNVFKKTHKALLHLEELQCNNVISVGDNVIDSIKRPIIVNSLFDYYENNNPNGDIMNLKSVYEESKTSGALLPDISSISTYELKVFSYIPESPIN